MSNPSFPPPTTTSFFSPPAGGICRASTSISKTGQSQIQTVPVPGTYFQNLSLASNNPLPARRIKPDQLRKPDPTALWQAVKAKDIDKIITLIKTHKTDPNRVFISPSTGSWTPLCYAAFHHYEDVVKVLVNNGANVDMNYQVKHSPHIDPDFSAFDNNNTWNALAFCAASKNVQACKLLLAANPRSLHDVMNESLNTGRYCNEVIQTLLEAGADPNGGVAAESDNHSTPLACAASRARLDELKLLLQYGADPNRGGAKPICRAVHWGITAQNTLICELIQAGAIFEPYYDYPEPPRMFPYYDHDRWQRDQNKLKELRSLHAKLLSVAQ